MIDIHKLQFRYSGAKHPVFQDFSLQIHEGSVVGLLAPNGVGKSTLLYLMTGLLLAKTGNGSIMVDGEDVTQRSHAALSQLYLLPEENTLPPTVLNKYVRARVPFYKDFSEEVLCSCLNEFGLPANPDIRELSMGQRKKVAISFAVATGTKYLLMDEPTNGLDIASKGQFRRIVAQHIADDRTLLLSTHQLADVEPLLDHFVMLGNNSENGTAQLLLDSSVTDLTQQYVCDLRPSLSADDSDVLYSERCADGVRVLLRRQADDDETPLNLELLYKYVISNNSIQ